MKYKPQLDQASNNCCVLRFSVVCRWSWQK